MLMGIGAGSYLAASFAVVQALVTPEEVSNAVGFMSVGKLHSNQLLNNEISYPDAMQHRTLGLSSSWQWQARSIRT